MNATQHNKMFTFCLFQGAALVAAISAGAAGGAEPSTNEVGKSEAAPSLFIDDLAAPDTAGKRPKCPEITTLACGEEPNGCSGC